MNIRTTLDIFNLLKGRWDLSRTISTAKNKQLINAHAEFLETDNHTLHYKETGTIDVNNTQQHFYREYQYNYFPADEIIKSYFYEDSRQGNYFHTLKFHSQSDDLVIAQDEHLCLQDNYKIRYTFCSGNIDHFEIEYDVEGPAKKYQSTTSFNRKK